jgi:hypothetical protein
MAEPECDDRIKNHYHLSWIPFFCSRSLDDAISRDEMEVYLKKARPELHESLRRLHEGSRVRTHTLLTCEERKALLQAESLRDRELIGYHMALRYLEKYARDSRKSNIVNARRHFRIAEECWKRLVAQMRNFVLVNLSGRRLIPIF